MRISDWSSDVCSSDLGNEPDINASALTLRQIIVFDFPQIIVQFINDGLPGGDFESRNLGVRNAGQVLYQRAERVAVRRDENSLTRSQLRRNAAFPIRHNARDSVFQAFGVRDGTDGKRVVEGKGGAVPV